MPEQMRQEAEISRNGKNFITVEKEKLLFGMDASEFVNLTGF
jgi:hypothetical protein